MTKSPHQNDAGFFDYQTIIILFLQQKTRIQWIRVITNADDRSRTGTMSPPPDFESGASANSATSAC